MQPERSESHTISSSGWQNLHRVTTVSKYLALLLFIALPFLGGWVGYTYAPTKTVEVTRSVPVVPEAPATVATESERPHEWYDQATQRLATSTATVTFTGSYQENEMTAWDRTVLCRQLYLRDYPQNELHEYYVHKALSGNTVQRFADHGLLLNLPWQEIPVADQRVIENASLQEPVTVELRKKVEIGRGAGPCYSFFEYVNILR